MIYYPLSNYIKFVVLGPVITLKTDIFCRESWEIKTSVQGAFKEFQCSNIIIQDFSQAMLFFICNACGESSKKFYVTKMKCCIYSVNPDLEKGSSNVLIYFPGFLVSDGVLQLQCVW